MSNKKRVFEETFDDNDELQQTLDYPPSKKRKTCPNMTEIESICKIIDQSSLTRHLGIPTSINKVIAEYARGEVKYCSNTQCKQPICVFNEDNTNTSEYKCCVSGSQIFCIDCMEFAIPAMEMSTHPIPPGPPENLCEVYDCHNSMYCSHTLQFIPDCSNCYACHQPLPEHCRCLYCGPQSRSVRKCYNCDAEICYKCAKSESINAPKSKCASCQRSACTQCKASHTNNGTLSQLGIFVCTHCYDERVIECGQCNTSYPLLFKRNTVLHANNAKMVRCSMRDCDVFICFGCNEEHDYCAPDPHHPDATALFCAEHIRWRVPTFEKQQEITYERALDTLLNQDRCVGVYDFTNKRWRHAKYFKHWGDTRKIMVSYTNKFNVNRNTIVNRDNDRLAKYGMLVFPSTCMFLP
eukprot:54984_1